jgi:PilZ domain
MRKFIRHPSDIPIDFKISDVEQPKPRRVRDVSLGGLCFNSDQPVPKGTAIHIRIPLLLQTAVPEEGVEQDIPFKADGVVAWCKPEANGYAVGVEFADPTTQFGLRMVEQVCHIEHYRSDVLHGEGRVLSSEEAAREWVERYAAAFPS